MRSYDLTPKKYRPEDELHLDPSSPQGQKRISSYQELFLEFHEKFSREFDLNSPEKIYGLFEEARRLGIFEKAEEARTTFYGKDMHFYGVTYLWDGCVENCTYCPAAIDNRKKAGYRARELSVEEAVEDVRCVMEDGHRHLCVLTAEEPIRHGAEHLARYVRALDELGLKEIILNVEPPRELSGYTLWASEARRTSLQFRIFQETYNRQCYKTLHPKTKLGRKHDYDLRYHSQLDALAYGIENVGIGVLFGNSPYPLEELFELKKHAEFIKAQGGKWPARVCLPTAKYLHDIEVKISFDINSKIDETTSSQSIVSQLIYALGRLAMPHLNLVSSERDTPEILHQLNRFATCTTLNVHPGVGDNTAFRASLKKEGKSFTQSTVFPRDPKFIRENMVAEGHTVFLA